MDDVLAFCQAASQQIKSLVPKLVWPGEEIEKEVVNTSTQTVISSVPETVCTCPISSQYITLCPIPNHAPRVIENPLELQPIQSSYENEQLQLLGELVSKGSFFVKIAGLSGVSAVAMGAYGAHTFKAEDADMKKVYDTANFYHFIHTLALLAVPLTNRPALTGTLMVTGTTIFCGTIYYHALTKENQSRKYTPYGGIVLMLGWLSMVL